MENEIPVTLEEYQKVEKEILSLKEESKRLSAEIARARDLGDLAENAEYHAAREQKAMIDAKISLLQTKLTSFKIVENSSSSSDEVRFGSLVKLYDMNFDEEIVCRIVSGGQSTKSDEISISSPVGKALLGHKSGDVVEISTPSGTIKYKIISIQ